MRTILILFFILAFCPIARAADEGGAALPRFASIKAAEVYARTGPSQNYPVRWVYNRKGLPVEIVDEFDVWRKIRDPAGDEGWVNRILLSGARTVLIRSDEPTEIRSRAGEDEGQPVARLEPGVIAALDKCEGDWCRIKAGGYRGWAARKFLWGIYEGENFN